MERAVEELWILLADGANACAQEHITAAIMNKVRDIIITGGSRLKSKENR